MLQQLKKQFPPFFYLMMGKFSIIKGHFYFIHLDVIMNVFIYPYQAKKMLETNKFLVLLVKTSFS